MEFNATFFVSIISFIVFTIIMNLIFYKPISKVIYERQNMISDALNDAKSSKEKTDEILKERDYKLNKSAADSKKLITDKLDEANTNSKDKTQLAKQRGVEELNSAKSDLNEQAEMLDQALKHEVKNLAEVISSNILGTDVKIDDAELTL